MYVKELLKEFLKIDFYILDLNLILFFVLGIGLAYKTGKYFQLERIEAIIGEIGCVLCTTITIILGGITIDPQYSRRPAYIFFFIISVSSEFISFFLGYEKSYNLEKQNEYENSN